MRVSTTPLAALVLSLPALCASFLLPPPPTDPELAAPFAVIPATSTTGSKAITAGCTRCTWHKDVSDDEGVPYQPGLESDLVFNVAISRDSHTLKINNINFLPFGPEIALTALQVPAKVASTDFFFVDHAFHSLKLGYDLLVTGSLLPGSSIKEIIVHLRITSVDGIRNDEIQEIEVTVHEDTTNSELKLIDVVKKPLSGPEHIWIDFPAPSPPIENNKEAGCEDLGCVLAKLRHKADRLRGNHVTAPGKKGCQGKEHGPPAHWENHYQAGPSRGGPRRGGPHRGGPHRHGRPHHGHHHRGNFLTTLVEQVLVPIFIGILAGVGVSLIGLVIGQGFIKLYQAVVNRRTAVDEHDNDDGTDEEKGLLKGMEVQEEEAFGGPPAYVEEGIEVAEKE